VRAEAELLGQLARRAEIRPTELAHVVYTPRNCDAARQLYRVASGLESMIVGEAEIQGQVKRATSSRSPPGTTGPMTNRLFQAALEAGKRVPHADRDRPRARQRVDRRRRARARRRRPARRAQRRRHRRGETSERTAQASPTRASRRSSSPTAAPTAPAPWPIASADRRSLDELPARLREADIVVASTVVAAPDRRGRRPQVVMRSRGRAPARPHRHRGSRATSTTPAARSRACASTTWTTCRPW
jgi:glutamyl-tRNA reductase